MITKTRIENAQKRFPPGAFVRFMFLLGEKKIKQVYMTILLIAFVGMFYETIILKTGYYSEWDVWMKIFFYIFVTMFPLTIANFVAIKINNARIERICRYLNISVDEYNRYINS